jgi:uncharacterized protein (TIGR03118 family)
MQQSVRRIFTLAACCWVVLTLSSAALAQFYTAAYLTANTTGKAKHTDALLANPWGLAYGPGAPFWISDEASGWSTLYDGTGTPQSLQVIIPPTAGTGAGTPTGIVYNGSTEFQIDTWTSAFLFATLDGTISGWSHFNPSAALIGVRHSGAVYTGLAITSKSSGNRLFAADVANNKVDVYDGSFNLVGSFTDPTTPTGYAPFGVQDIAGRVYVSYAQSSGGPGGFVSVFKEDGTFVKRFIRGTPLNQPWGMAVAPSNFGPLSETFLVSNNTKAGTINGFNATTGKLVGTVKNMAGVPIRINGLWGIEFGGGTVANGKTNQLFFTSGPGNTGGLFGAINSH